MGRSLSCHKNGSDRISLDHLEIQVIDPDHFRYNLFSLIKALNIHLGG